MFDDPGVIALYHFVLDERKKLLGRSTYVLFDLLADLGGILGVLVPLGAVFVSFVNSKSA